MENSIFHLMKIFFTIALIRPRKKVFCFWSVCLLEIDAAFFVVVFLDGTLFAEIVSTFLVFLCIYKCISIDCLCL